MLFRNFKDHKNKTALICDKFGKFTYNDLISEALKLKKIVPAGSFVVLVSDNSILSVIFYISLMRNNNVILLIDSKTSKEKILAIIKNYKSPYLICPSEFFKKNKLNKNFLYIENYFSYCVNKNLKKIKIFTNKNLCLLLPTSGTTGSLKYVRLSRKNLKSNSDSIIDYLKIKSSDRAICIMPITYSYGLSIVNTHLEKGASIYLNNQSIMQKSFWQNYKKNKITSLSGVPYMYQIFLKYGLKNLYLPSLKTLTQAGGKLDKTLNLKIIKFCKLKKIKFISMYGQTEASPRISFLDWKYAFKKIGSIGKNIKSVKIWLEDEKNKKIYKPGKIGEIVIKGKNVCMGYCENVKDLNKPDENKEVLKTGDLGYFDKDNFFYIHGRKSRIAKVYGLRVSLDDLEKKLMKIGYEVACMNYNNIITIFYTLKNKKSNILKTLVKETGMHESTFKLKHIFKIPRNNSGKIDFANLKYYR